MRTDRIHPVAVAVMAIVITLIALATPGCAIRTENMEAVVPTCTPETKPCTHVRKTEVSGIRLRGGSVSVDACTIVGDIPEGASVDYDACKVTGVGGGE